MAVIFTELLKIAVCVSVLIFNCWHGSKTSEEFSKAVGVLAGGVSLVTATGNSSTVSEHTDWSLGVAACLVSGISSAFAGAFGGIVVGMVVKYADNILKNFANALSVICTVLLAIPLFDQYPSPWSILGKPAIDAMWPVHLH
eukprot:scaffold26360_cov50-Prasinocladus_malaysianus.AAC.1